MPTKSAFSVVGLAHKVCLAAEEQGWTPEMLNALAEHPTRLGEFRSVHVGLSEIKPLAHLINCDADPFIPAGWSVGEHQKGGQFAWSPDAVALYLANGQKKGRIIGTELRKKLRDKPVLNANVLDWLLQQENQHLIPEEWKSKYVFFWGTIYRNSVGDPCARYLCWSAGRWRSRCLWLGCSWGGSYPAALRAS